MSDPAAQFGERLSLAMKLLNISQGALSSEARADKSLVSRWARGIAAPRGPYLAVLTGIVRARVPAFNQLSWNLPLDIFARLLSGEVPAVPVVGPVPAYAPVAAVPPPTGVPSGFAEWLALPKLREIAAHTASPGRSLVGFWRTTRPSPEMPGRFVHDRVIIEPTPDGPLSFRMGLFSSRLVGWSVAMGDQMYSCATNRAVGSSIFAIFIRVNRPRLEVFDGVTIACMADAGGVPMAAACLVERTGDLSGDAAADEARYEELLAEHPIAPEGSIPDAVYRHLMRDIGPAAMASGGDPMLMMRSMTSMARGSSPGLRGGSSAAVD